MLTDQQIAMRRLLARLLRRSVNAAERRKAQALLARCPHDDAIGLAIRQLLK